MARVGCGSSPLRKRDHARPPRWLRSGSLPIPPRSSRAQASRSCEHLATTSSGQPCRRSVSRVSIRADEAIRRHSWPRRTRRRSTATLIALASRSIPAFGTEEDFIAMGRTAAAHNAVVIDDIVPAHTGKGADYRLAELALWGVSGPVPYGRNSARPIGRCCPTVPAGARRGESCLRRRWINCSDKGYIVGQLRRVIFFEPGVKETDWSATDVIVGVDGVARRWVYLHYFKEGQPSLNWLDPSFAAPQMIIGDALHSLDVLGARIAAARRQRLSRRRAPCRRPGLVGRPSALRRRQPVDRRNGAQGRRLHLSRSST